MDPRKEYNVHPATNASQCKEMGRINNWDFVDAQPSGDPILKVNCFFDGPQTNFTDQDPYADLGDDDE